MFEGATLARFGYTILKDASKLVSKYIKFDSQFMTDALTKHIVHAEAWSATINMLGLSMPADIEKQSIALAISSQPRKFHAVRDPDATTDESHILESSSSIIILGDPGAGKTTAIKRSLRRLIVESQELGALNYEFPLLVFGRDLSNDSNLFEAIFNAIGFTISPGTAGINSKEFDDWLRNRPAHIRQAVTTALLNAPVIVFIDGIDEINPTWRSDFERDVEYLNNTMSRGKIIATCRSGDWNRPLSNFEVYEINSLSETQIETIAAMWANDPTAFQSAISNIPYKEILDRPLLLTLLIIIFNQTGGLPDQPVDVYQRFVTLLISEWDEQRDIKRPSRFADFQSGRKSKFLSDAAYQLMMHIGVTRFNRMQILSALESTAARFGQSAEEIYAIVKELESHTGILVEAGFGNFEFCHLTVQEYLAASYLVGLSARSRDLEAVVNRSPATFAVAVSLASDPTAFLAEGLMELLGPHSGPFRHPARSKFLKSFLARLRLERPTLTPSHMLGLSALLVVHTFDAGSILKRSIPEYLSMWDEIAPFLKQPAVRSSLDFIERIVEWRENPYEAGEIVISVNPGSFFSRYLGDPTLELSLSDAVLSALAELEVCDWLTRRH